MHSNEILSARVRQHGGKVTPQRLLIWQTLREDRTHPTAEELFGRLRLQAPTLSLTTVYNILRELVEWGETRRFDAGDGSIHYDPDTSPHAELICMRCHAVIDVPDEQPGIPRVRDVPEEIAGYRIVTHSEQYYGFCPDCRAALAQEESATRTERANY